MNLTNNPELLDQLASAYALGTLRYGARNRFENLAREHAQIRAAALLWQSRWAALSEVQSPVQPPAAVWIRISNLLQAEKTNAIPAQQSTIAAAKSAVLAWWRNAALAGGLATITASCAGLWIYQGLKNESRQQISSLQTQLQTVQSALQATPQIQYVAVLADKQAAASMLITFDPVHSQLSLQRVGQFQESANQSLQLWALPQQGAPQSLGVLGHEKIEQLAATTTKIQTAPTLAISLEPKGGVPSETGPTGPVLFTGALIRREI